MKPITKEKIGWGFIGTGRIAQEFANCLGQLDDGYVAAVGSRSIESAKRFTDVYGGKPYGSYEEMLQDPDVDVVYVATPHMVHEENVVMAAKYGKNILCEKPFALNRPQAQRMFDAAKEADVFLMEGLWSRFFPAWQYVRKVIESGEMGQLISIDAATCWGARRGPGGFPPEDRRVNPNLAGGALLDAGIYVLAAASVIVGGMTKMPKNVFGTMRFEESGVDSDTDMLLELEDGVTAHLVCSLHKRNHEVTIYFENGSIHIPSHRNPKTVTISKRTFSNVSGPSGHAFDTIETRTLEFPYRATGFQFEAAAVHECLRKGLTVCPSVTPEETLTLIGICDIMRKKYGFQYPFKEDEILFKD